MFLFPVSSSGVLQPHTDTELSKLSDGPSSATFSAWDVVCPLYVPASPTLRGCHPMTPVKDTHRPEGPHQVTHPSVQGGHLHPSTSSPDQMCVKTLSRAISIGALPEIAFFINRPGYHLCLFIQPLRF